MRNTQRHRVCPEIKELVKTAHGLWLKLRHNFIYCMPMWCQTWPFIFFESTVKRPAGRHGVTARQNVNKAEAQKLADQRAAV